MTSSVVMDPTADGNDSALLPAPARQGRKRKASSAAGGGGGQKVIKFTVTEGNEVAQVARGGGARVLRSESFLDEATSTRYHFVDVQGKAEAMLFLVSVDEDQRRIVKVLRCS